MKDDTETLLKFEGFDAWGWKTEFQQTLAAERPDAVRAIVDRMRLDLLRSFVDFVREVVDQEFRLGLLVRVERVTAKQIVGSADFGNDRRGALARVEERIFLSRGRLPKPCRKGPVLDRLLACTEIVRSDRLDSELGDLKRECVARFRNDGTISNAIKFAEPDGADPYFRYLFPAPTGFAPK
jgi:hypothetical protein